jgi:transposase-like protein
MAKTNPYPTEFKLKVIETMLEEKLSAAEAARRFQVGGHHTVSDWYKIYQSKGPDGFKPDGVKQNKSKPKEETLEEKVARLETELEIIKKLEALAISIIAKKGVSSSR